MECLGVGSEGYQLLGLADWLALDSVESQVLDSGDCQVLGSEVCLALDLVLESRVPGWELGSVDYQELGWELGSVGLDSELGLELGSVEPDLGQDLVVFLAGSGAV